MNLRNLPSVDALLQQAEKSLSEEYGRSLLTQAIRAALEEVRGEIRAGGLLPPSETILARAQSRLAAWTKPSLESVINATGVILHTNLGRAPLSQAATQAILSAASAYNNLEFDMQTGKRGSRLVHAEELLKRLTGAEAAVVVNNCASAVLLVLSALAKNKRVIIPRSQLVEIGGGFRVPDVMQQSGAKLVEVGATNKVRLEDYEEAYLQAPAGTLFMRAHRSNFRLTGFTEEPTLAQVADMAHYYQTLALDDLGSGTLLDVSAYGLTHEPTVQESLQAGADVVMFSGDKLLGGPQAGIILGRADLLAKIKKHPLARAVRADKLRLAALNATLLHYLKGEAERHIPIWQMIAAPAAQLQARANAWQTETGLGQVAAAESTIGGGSLPGETLPTFVLRLPVKSADKFLAALRHFPTPVIARAEDGAVLFDPRTVLPQEEPTLLRALTTLTPEFL